MSNKKKNKNKNNHPVQKGPAHSMPVRPPASSAVESAREALASASDEAVAAATDAERNCVSQLSVAAASPTFDLVTESNRVVNALELCRLREGRLDERQRALDTREAAALTRDGQLDSRQARLDETERVMKEERADLERSRRNLGDQEARLNTHESTLRARELNAEAGFSTERRESLRLLDQEAATLRTELSTVRAQIAKERAAWDAERRGADEKLRDEHRRASEVHRSTLDRLERDSRERLQVQQEQLTRDLGELRRAQALLEAERSNLADDRAAFDVRVERHAGQELEDARATQADLEARLASARNKRDELYERLRGREEAERVLGNRPLEEVKAELDALTRERDDLKTQLAQRPNRDAAERLAFLERAQEDWETERARLTQECVAAKTALARASIAVTEIETLRDQKMALESGKDLLHAALQELRKDVDERIRRADGDTPFPACSQMDVDDHLRTAPPLAEREPDLAALCRDLQHRIATDPEHPDKVLYFSLTDIRCFLGGLAMSRLHLLQGISGTGKTSLPLAMARALGAGSTLVEVQAGWRDRQDLIGHFNAFERKFYESEFLQALYRAQCPFYADRIYIVVLDEMNLSHPEQYFADLLSALEQDPHRRKLHLMPKGINPAPSLLEDGRTIAIPQNVWFVGTANHDETTKEFADKTYDRAHVMELPRSRVPFEIRPLQPRQPMSATALSGAFRDAQSRHAGEARKAYAFLDESLGDLLGRRFRVGWGNRLERQMLDFVPVILAAGGTVEEAIDHVLATKLLRKVRDRHDTREEDLKALRQQLEEVWPQLGGHGPATKSTELIDAELRRLGGVDSP